jgi:hypothetical protein
MAFAIGAVLLNKQTEHNASQQEWVLHKHCAVKRYLAIQITEILLISNVYSMSQDNSVGIATG